MYEANPALAPAVMAPNGNIKLPTDNPITAIPQFFQKL